MWYEDHNQYVVEDGLAERTWPASLSLVQVYKNQNNDLVTTSGWGEAQFMKNYEEGKFSPEPYLRRFQHGRAFGIIMRSVPYLCVDIDGKNGGIEASRILMLPPTLAETSKSGNGYHLFYRLPEATWDPEKGYADYPDAIGIIPGVDIRVVGIVYHYPQQRWNTQQVASLPRGLQRLMDAHKKSREITLARSNNILTGEDAAIRAYELKEELQKPASIGGRNKQLFRWGCMAHKYIANWEQLLIDRGQEMDLDLRECQAIVKSVHKYGIGAGNS